MYLLHFAPDNASLIVRLLLEELGQPYRTVLVDRATRAQDSAAFRAISPAGRIPALETPQGPMFETAAIVLHLCDVHGGLFPAPDAPERGAALSWQFFLSNTLHADLRMVFYPEQYAGSDPATQRALHAAMIARLTGHFDLLETLARRGHGWFAGAQPSALDVYTTVVIRWARLYARLGAGWFDPARVPRLQAMAAAMEPRASVQAAIRAEGFGPQPFTHPQLPQPPEGSAL